MAETVADRDRIELDKIPVNIGSDSLGTENPKQPGKRYPAGQDVGPDEKQTRPRYRFQSDGLESVALVTADWSR